MTKVNTKKLIKNILIWFLVLGIVALYIFGNVIPRFTKYTSFYPFSHRIFNLDPDEVEEIMLQSGLGKRVSYVYRHEIEDICEALNSARYSHSFPIIDIPSGGYDYIMTIYFFDGTSSGCIEYYDTNISINNIVYTYNAPVFKFLTDPLDELANTY
ncbi:MAG: hypothetical protein J6D11_02430 [Clostridia bacterium]|nr:hypothetical protein [Clostridia bacterium]